MGDRCAGYALACSINLTRVLPMLDRTRVYPIGKAEKVMLTFSNGQLTQGVASGILAGEDDLGSPTFETLQFVPEVGFANPRVHRDHVNLVDKHPNEFFESPVLRKRLADAVEPLLFARGVPSARLQL